MKIKKRNLKTTKFNDSCEKIKKIKSYDENRKIRKIGNYGIIITFDLFDFFTTIIKLRRF